jgi:hypothetical protein
MTADWTREELVAIINEPPARSERAAKANERDGKPHKVH